MNGYDTRHDAEARVRLCAKTRAVFPHAAPTNFLPIMGALIEAIEALEARVAALEGKAPVKVTPKVSAPMAPAAAPAATAPVSSSGGLAVGDLRRRVGLPPRPGA